MFTKKYFTPLMSTLLSVLALVALINLMGVQHGALIQRILILAVYGLILVSYLIRIALIFMGVFAAYQIFRAMVNGENFKGMGV